MSEWAFERVASIVPSPQLANCREINDSTMMRHLEQLLLADPDDRLDYLKQVDPDITDDQLDRIVLITERWLDDDARSRMRALARICYDNGSDARILYWTGIQPRKLRANRPSSGARTSALDLAMCYAVSEAQRHGVRCLLHLQGARRTRR